MAHYVQLLTMTPEGRAKLLEDPEFVLHVQRSTTIEGVEVLGLYAVLGEYDFVSIVDAPDNAAVGRYSIALGVRAGVLITTMPAVPAALLDERASGGASEREEGAEVGRAGDERGGLSV